MKHTLIVGVRHVGKSTLIRCVLQEINRPVFGFEIQKDWLAEEENGSLVYIYGAGEEPVQREDNLVGYCRERCFRTNTDTFDRFALRLVNPPKGSIILLDEIGFMESSSEAFWQRL